MVNAAFLIGAKRYKYLWWYLLAVIPLVNIVFFVAFFIYTGVKGHEIAARGTQFANQSEYDGFVKGLDHAGKVLFWVVVILFVLWLILFAVGMNFWFHPKILQPGYSPLPRVGTGY